MILDPNDRAAWLAGESLCPRCPYCKEDLDNGYCETCDESFDVEEPEPEESEHCGPYGESDWPNEG